MSWQRRLAELAAAGGLAIAATGCPAVIPGGTCNANPDPCCSQPDGTACMAQMACIAEPNVTCCQSAGAFDQPCVAPACDPLDAQAACGTNPGVGCFGPSLQGRHINDDAWKCDVVPTDPAACATGTIGGVLDVSGPACFPLCAPGEAYLGNPNPQEPLGVAPHTCAANERCVYSWRFEVDVDGVLHRSPTSDTVGICIDGAKLKYDSDNDGFEDMPWPACETQPLHGSSNVPDAAMMGCVTSTTAGL